MRKRREAAEPGLRGVLKSTEKRGIETNREDGGIKKFFVIFGNTMLDQETEHARDVADVR